MSSPDFGILPFLVKAPPQGQSFEGRSWEDLFDLAQGWVDGLGLADATMNSSKNTSETDVAPWYYKWIGYGWDGMD